VHLQFARRRRRVDPFRETDERDPKRLELIEQRDQVFEIASKPVEALADQYVESTASRSRANTDR
jgi:hypothetical protein